MNEMIFSVIEMASVAPSFIAKTTIANIDPTYEVAMSDEYAKYTLYTFN